MPNPKCRRTTRWRLKVFVPIDVSNLWHCAWLVSEKKLLYMTNRYPSNSMSNHFTTLEMKFYGNLKSENVYFDRENYRSSINDYFNKFLSFGFL